MQKAEIARGILAYLAGHPGAQDTLEGIIEWWLLEQRIRDQMAAVREALSELVAENLILEKEGRDSRTRYRINGRRLKKIRKVLGQEA